MSYQAPLSQTLYEFHTSTPSKKSDPEFGRTVARQMVNTIRDGLNGYYVKRNRRFADLRKIAQGRHDMREFLDLMGIDGKNAYVKLDMTPPAILPKFLDIVVERFMELEERPTVTAVDDNSKQQRQKEINEAEFAMNMGGVIAGLEQQAGIPLVDPNKYIPENYDDLTLYFETEHKLPEEVKFQKRILDALDDGGYEVFKRSMLYDLVEVGMAWAFVYKDENGAKKYRRCIPENTIYSWSNYDDFRDSTVIGELEKMKVSDIRARFPKINERTLFDMFKRTDQGGKAELSWAEEFRVMLIRPYDDCVVELFHFQIVTTEERMWVEKRDSYGKSVLNEKKERPKYLGDNKTLIEKRLKVVYTGCYSRTTDEMLEWRVMENMIKPHYAMHEAFTNYVGFMPNNRDMVNISLTERSITAIRMLSLIQLKKQQLIAKMRPDGLLVNTRALQGVHLGMGQDAESPLELQAMYDQTGIQYYTDLDEDGETRNGAPIQPIESNGNAQSLMALDREYNFWIDKLRSDLGTNEYVEGQSVNPKLGLGVMNNQISASNRATNFVYRGFLSILEGIAKRIAIMDWYDIVETGSREYGITPDEMEGKIFDIKIDMAPTDTDRMYIEQMAQTALSAGLITFEEAVKVRRIAKENVKLAEIYLGKYEAKRKREQQESAQQNSMVQAQIQDQVAKNKAQSDALLLQGKGQFDLKKQQMLNEAAKTQVMGQVVNTILSEWMKMGKSVSEMPQEFQSMVSAFMQNMVGSQQLQAARNEQEAGEMQQEMMESQQEAMMQQQEGQPDMEEGMQSPEGQQPEMESEMEMPESEGPQEGQEAETED